MPVWFLEDYAGITHPLVGDTHPGGPIVANGHLSDPPGSPGTGLPASCYLSLAVYHPLLHHLGAHLLTQWHRFQTDSGYFPLAPCLSSD